MKHTYDINIGLEHIYTNYVEFVKYVLQNKIDKMLIKSANIF
jgi:hypothetical protein